MWHFQSVPAHQSCQPAFGVNKLEALSHAAWKRAQRTHPSMAVAAAAPFLQEEGEADGRHESLVKPRYRQRNKQTAFFSFFLFSFYSLCFILFFSSVNVSQVLSMSKYGTHTLTHAHAFSLCVTLSPLFISMLHSIICGNMIAGLIIEYKMTHDDVTSSKLTCVEVV